MSCCEFKGKFQTLKSDGRIWTIPAIHGCYDSLRYLHDLIAPDFRSGDQLVYLGNYIGFHRHSADTINEILAFRRSILAIRGQRPTDIVYLRGSQEEILEKLFQLPFAKSPTDALLWMLGNGLSETLYGYDISPHDGIEACRGGIMHLIKWTNYVRETIYARLGHRAFFTSLKRAAYTNDDQPLLFVNAGINPNLDLDSQLDNFWWDSEAFDAMEQNYMSFRKIVRGYDPKHRGIQLNCIKATVDGGCGFGGPLVSICYSNDGNILSMREAQ